MFLSVGRCEALDRCSTVKVGADPKGLVERGRGEAGGSKVRITKLSSYWIQSLSRTKEHTLYFSICPTINSLETFYFLCDLLCAGLWAQLPISTPGQRAKIVDLGVFPSVHHKFPPPSPPLSVQPVANHMTLVSLHSPNCLK